MKPEVGSMLPERQRNITWYRIGDCVNPGNAFEAIDQAFDLALKI
jgi:hypothetical protein